MHVITDHKALEFFKLQSKLSNQQLRWINYMARFNFNITYVMDGPNKVADYLLRYYESDVPSDILQFHKYVHVD
jgi:hypothetical protein